MYLRLMSIDFSDTKNIKAVLQSRHCSSLYASIGKTGINKNERLFMVVDPLAKQYYSSLENYVNGFFKKKKRKKQTIGFSIALVLVLGTTGTALSFLMPEKIFPTNYIKYSINGKEMTKEVHFNESFELDVPQKVGYRFDGYYDSESDNAKKIVNENLNYTIYSPLFLFLLIISLLKWDYTVKIFRKFIVGPINAVSSGVFSKAEKVTPNRRTKTK